MTFKEFMEMALKSFKTGPFVDDDLNPTGQDYARKITRSDEKIVTHPKTHRQLEIALNRSTHFNWNIIVGQPPPTRWEGYTGTKNYVMSLAKKGEIELDDHITFIKTSSTGEPLTAWMILHNIGHAILDAMSIGGDMMVKIERLLKGITKNDTDDERGVVKDLASNFKFRSARTTMKDPDSKLGITNMEEVIFELMAEYLWHGHIRPQTPNPIYKQIEECLHTALRDAVGKIIVDNG